MRVCVMWCCDAVTCPGVYSNAANYISIINSRSCKYVLQFKVTYKSDWAGCYTCCFLFV